MSLLFDHSPFEPSQKERQFISSSLKKFKDSPLAYSSQEDLKTAQQVAKTLKHPHSKIFIFAFGGSGFKTKILNSAFISKNKNVILIDEINSSFLDLLKSFKPSDFKLFQFLFISQSGKTKEILFYTSFLEKIFLKHKMSLNGKITALSQSPDNPLSKWVIQNKGTLVLSKHSLPGRFSFWTLSGLVQSQLCDFNEDFSVSPNPSIQKALEFLIHYSFKRQEIFFSPLDSCLKELAHWLELAWSESLFKAETKQKPSSLRNVDFYDLRHASIEELIHKNKTSFFWALSSVSSPYEKPLKNILNIKKIPYMFVKFSLEDKKNLSELMSFFYKVLFCMGDFSQSNIYTQDGVDFFKNQC